MLTFFKNHLYFRKFLIHSSINSAGKLIEQSSHCEILLIEGEKENPSLYCFFIYLYTFIVLIYLKYTHSLGKNFRAISDFD